MTQDIILIETDEITTILTEAIQGPPGISQITTNTDTPINGVLKGNGTKIEVATKSDLGLSNVDNTSDLNKPISTATQTALDNKVDKIVGKGLSQEDYTTTEKSKLAGIEAGAEVNNISDVNATDLTDGGDTTLHTHDGRYYTESETDTLLGGKMDIATYDPSGTARQVAFACTVQSVITDYTFTGAEPTSSGYLVTTASDRTVNINADLFTTGYEVIFCKGTDNANTVTLDAGSGNNINGSQTYVLDKFNETVVLVKDGDSTWKIKAGNVPKSTLVQTTGDQTILGNKNFDNVLYVDDTNGRVGVGTTTPDSRLVVKSSSANSNNTRWESSDGQTLASLYEESDTRSSFSLSNASGVQTVRFDTNGNSYFNGGNLGIGETSPDYKLDVNGSFGFTPGIGTTITPVDNGDIVFQSTSNTSLEFKLKGSDGVIRSGQVPLSSIDTNRNLYIQDTAPTVSAPSLWIDTTGGGITFNLVTP